MSENQPEPSVDAPWYERAYKWVVTSSHRDDWHPDVYKNFDPDRWIETIASCGLDVLFYQSKSHSGNAYYHTPLEHVHLGLKGVDALGEMLERCHAHNIRFVVNHSILYDNYVFKTHPEWRMRDADGRDSKHFGRGGRAPIVCWNSPYRDLAIRQLDAFAEKYLIDGIFFDMMFVWIPVCYCEHCRDAYMTDCGAVLPGRDDRSSTSFRRYAKWRDRKLYDFTRDLVDTFKAHRPAAMATFNSPRPHRERPSVLDRAELADVLSGDPTHGGGVGAWSGVSIGFASNVWSNLTKNPPARIDLGRMPGHEGQHTGMRSLEELKQSAAVCMAHNCAVLYIDACNADGTLYESPFRAYKQVFDMMRPVEPFLAGEKVRSVAIYVSAETKDYINESGGGAEGLYGTVTEFSSGLEEAYAAFDRQHVPADLITRLALDRLTEYDLVVIPDALCMRESEAAAFRAYVEGGGRLLATRYVGLLDEDGERRANFALADVLGVDYLGETENNETYMGVPEDLCREAGIPEDMEVKVDRQTVVRSHPGAEVVAHEIMPYTNRATDAEGWIGIHDSPPGIVTDYPAIVTNRFGSGSTCYMTGRIHSAGGANGNSFNVREPRALMYALSRRLVPEVPLSCDGPPWLIVTAFRQPEENRIVVHAVSAQEDVPILPLESVGFRLRLRDDELASEVVLQPEGEAVSFERHGSDVTFTAPVRLYQCITVMLG